MLQTETDIHDINKNHRGNQSIQATELLILTYQKGCETTETTFSDNPSLLASVDCVGGARHLVQQSWINKSCEYKNKQPFSQ